MEEIQRSGFDQSVPTIACGNISFANDRGVLDRDSPLVVQVTRKFVYAANVAFAQQVAYWEAPSPITVANVSGTQVCVATQGGRLFILSLMPHEDRQAFYEVA